MFILGSSVRKLRCVGGAFKFTNLHELSLSLPLLSTLLTRLLGTLVLVCSPPMHKSVAHLSRSCQFRFFATASTGSGPAPAPTMQVEKIPKLALSSLSTSDFANLYYKQQTPVIVTGGMQDWPFVQRQLDFQFLRRSFGANQVTVEKGTYTSKAFEGDVEMPLALVIDQFLRAPAPPATAATITVNPETTQRPPQYYLAQRQLMDTMPQLEKLIRVPSFIAEVCQQPEQVNVWLGPSDTVSPLHHDPYHNVLCQLLGSKYVRLYSPHLPPPTSLYPRSDLLFRNTSQVDAQSPDLSRFPNFPAHGPYMHNILHPGEILFLPVKWWHYIRSLTPSLSVNYWWT